MKLWGVWNIPACILLSLFLQVFLVLFASLRQRSRNSFLRFLICLAYLSADWVAAVTIGLITKFLTDPCHSRGKEDLYTFWVSFLLLHLGGPDSITSFAIEDNELWRRHFFGLILRVVGAAYYFFLILANSKLWLPTILVFVVGTVKYAERTLALYLASTDHFGAIALPKKSRAGEVVNNNPNTESVVDDDMELLMISYDLFGKFKGLIAGYSLAFEQIVKSIEYFQRMPYLEMGFKLIENELSFLYEVFHTKVCVVGSRIGLIIRLSSFCFIVGAFIGFHFVIVDNYKNHEFGAFEMSVTYALLIGAVGLDIISGIRLIFSDWIVASNYYGFKRYWREYIPRCFRKRSKWCGSVPRYNIIDYFLDESWILNTKLPGWLRRVVDNIKGMLFSSSEDANEHLKRFIFDELKAASFQTHGTDEDRRNYLSSEQESAVVKARDHVNYTLQFTFDVVSLHLATEICYQLTEFEYADERKESNNCKVISDYMCYLLIMKPAMLAPVAMKD
ncbi:uncharacterized protein LOC107403262 [Ziziphus jujuba]|uniref:Uncharacterized protein LOC107403262 n=2 Tax=Ziziphus jujuba TaxID=326968 RepID=A0AC41YDU0_ZIZJJ|nr:uncharacterized protein LOC107403262 [Ziziphus jujuba]